ncbi:hypothetical protein EAX61_14920, partial [Dokdonia sinensis]
MKKILLLLFVLSFGYSAFAQVKVGDNPNTIDSSSLLELESADRVLVITRVTTVQMNAITPLAGALVYNTDEQCLFQYNGATWSSLCVMINETVSPLINNNDGTYTYTDETGATQLIDTRAESNPYDGTSSGLIATNVQDAIDEINASAGNIGLTDNGDGTYTFTDGDGNTTTIEDTSISTLIDNGDGTYTYTDENGSVQTIDTNASTNPYDNTISGLNATNVQDAIDEINGAAGMVMIVDNGDGTYLFTDSMGATTLISDTSISTLIDNTDGTYTYTDETGVTTTIDTNALTNPYNNAVSGLIATNVQDAIDEINAAAGTVGLIDNGDGTYIFTDANGTTTLISDTTISTLVDNGNFSYTYTDETGATTTFSINGVTVADNNDGRIIALVTEPDGDVINIEETITSLVNNNDGTYTYTNEDGATTIISDTSLSTLVDNGDGTYTYTDETGATTTIDTNALSNPYDNTVSMLTATNVQDAIDEINASAGTVSLVPGANDGEFIFTDASGATTLISDTSISTIVDNGDGTYT